MKKTRPSQGRTDSESRSSPIPPGNRHVPHHAFTPRQGQFLAFIHLYRKLHRQGPAERDLVEYFRVTPPTVHGMVVKLEELGLITRKPGVARSLRVTISVELIPALDDDDDGERLAGP